MKNRAIIAGAFALAILCACGGGGSSPIPQSTPTPKPTSKPTSYSVRWDWFGMMHAQGSKLGALRRAMAAGQATPEPIQMAAQPCTVGTTCTTSAFQPNMSINTAVVSADVNPSPQPSVVPTWAPPPSNVVEPSAVPGSTPAPGELQIASANTTPGTFTLDGTVPIPGDPQTVSPTGYEFPSAILGDPALFGGNASIGYVFTNGAAVPTNSPSSADIYVQNVGGVETLYIPGGAASYSINNVSLIDITTSSWSNQFTSITFPNLTNDLDTQVWMFQFPTQSGHYVRIFVASVIGSGAVYFSYDESGYSLTGSY